MNNHAICFDSFREHYQPWLPFSICVSPTPFLMLTIYILSSRHLPQQTTSIFHTLSPRFQSHLLSCFLADPSTLDIGAVQALSILSIWFPFATYGPSRLADGLPSDSNWVPVTYSWASQCSLQTLALNISRRIGLDKALVALKQAAVFGIEIEEQEKRELLEKARLVSLRITTDVQSGAVCADHARRC